jgi:pre-mRNA-processing factor SLU7
MQPSEWYARGQRAGPAATKYRKGACQNCGAMTHTAKDCLERPRKLGAKWTGRDIQADEIIRKFDQSFEGKRDRWNGYDSREYSKIMEEYERVEETRKALKEAQRKSDAAKAEEEDGISDDENKYEYEPDTPGQGYDEKTRTSTRNLRIREDTAKYLLKTGSTSHYDPKSRSMRELPDGSQTVDDSKLQNGKQEFQRASGDAVEFEKLQKFAWQSERAGVDAHLQANPTESEIRHKKLVGEAEKKKSTIRSNVLDKYGGVEHLAAPPKELLKSTEQFVEYTKTGEVIKGAEPASTKSRYPEDGMSVCYPGLQLVYVNNHTSVFGSWFRNGKWGYACCHQIHKNSYCTGAQGIEADQAAYRLARGEIDDMPPPPPPKKEIKQADVGQIRDGIKESTKRKRPDDAGFQIEGRTMTVAESTTMSEQEYEDYRKNKMARSDDPLLAMKALDGSV